MNFLNKHIQPVCISLPEWGDRMAEAESYFVSKGIEPYWVDGIHAEKFGVEAVRPYQRDVPDTDWRLPQKTVGGYLSAYMVFVMCLSHPNWDYILYLEDDTRFHDDFNLRYEKALHDVPDDFDWLFLSHCCTQGRETRHIKGEVHEVKYPMAGHVSLIARKALPKLIHGCRDACIPMDVDLFDNVFKDMNVYTVLPRMAEQANTHLPV